MTDLLEQYFDACVNADMDFLRTYFKQYPYDHVRNPSVHQEDEYGQTALMYACEYNHVELVKYLLTSNELVEQADINSCDKSGITILMKACQHGSKELVEYLLFSEELKTHPYLHYRDNTQKNYFMHACQRANEEVVKYLLTQETLNIDIYEKSDLGNTAIHFAFLGGSKEMVEYMLDSQDLSIHAHIYQKNDKGQTPIYYAINAENDELMEYLLNSKWRATILNQLHEKDKEGMSAFMRLCELNPFHMLNNRTNNIFHLLVVTHNIEITEDEKIWLKEKNLNHILDVIQSRDLYQKMSVSFSEKSTKKKSKI